ncbi:glutaminyl-peptide cyclotransferase [Massilia sp. PAMC28688]|uniref:glutaminyl-peptide cyclotransferase n=1 Tax=Massilia sp. PAMC28688 TaxID=2861283 RepID=UPI001E5B8400|nr:glutaminyl-peptide cyclotransferase [Massilia sp. PAMC28688]
MRKIAASVLLCTSLGAPAVQAAIPVYSYVVKNTYPHDPEAFTQGLFYRDGFLYEGTGMNGRSSIRKVELTTGRVLKQHDLASKYFGEGIAEVNGDIVGLTWTSQVGMVYDGKTFKEKKRFTYSGEGWGLTSNGTQLYMSDGSSYIRVLNDKMEEVRRFEVIADGNPINRLNELEWVDGEIYANVWGTDVIARINPLNGKVVGWIVLKNLLRGPAQASTPVDAVLNGIAYDSKGKRLFVTGKLWPLLFEIDLVEVKTPGRKP